MTKQAYIMAHDTARQRAIQAVKDAPEGHMRSLVILSNKGLI